MNQTAIPPRRSRRLATFTPASHWIRIGYSAEDAQLMEKLQNDMKKYYDGSDETEIGLSGSEPGTIIPHHDMMIPHWQKLFKALNGRTSTNLYFTGISLHYTSFRYYVFSIAVS